MAAWRQRGEAGPRRDETKTARPSPCKERAGRRGTARARCAMTASNADGSPFQVNYGNRPRYTALQGYRVAIGGREAQVFATEVARVQASGALGQAGRLRE